jgi:hypothetical protein
VQCTEFLFGVCLVPTAGSSSLFSFKDFIAALALLIIVYTVSDIRYRFRVAVAPIPLFTITYALISAIGFLTLLTDVWINEKWLVPSTPFITTAIWQGILAALFLGLVITWMHYAFMRPPTFGRNNYKQYAQELYRIVLKGSEGELPIIAHELSASARSLVTLASGAEKRKGESESPKACAEGYASDLLLLIANRKFCRHLVASSPVTAIRLLDAVSDAKAYDVPIGPFAQNVSTEAIRNKDSALYHEDEGYTAGLLGYVKPFSQALYGNYELVEGLRNQGPLDVHYKSVWSWDADQFEAYSRVALMTLKSYLALKRWGVHSFVLTRTVHEIQETTSRAISDVKKAGDDYYGDAWHRLRAGVRFIKDSIDAIGELDPPPDARTLRVRSKTKYRDGDLYDRLADAMFEIIHSAAYIEGPVDKAWVIHPNMVWGEFFELGKNHRAWSIVRFKLRRLLYDEIKELETLPHYKSARILGICLNVMGLKMGKRSGYGREQTALKAAVLAWTQRNYLKLRQVNEDIADSCVIGSITFDAEKERLVKTYAKGLEPEPHREYLDLQKLIAAVPVPS